jgi:lipopolysaccharide transport system ATP-binding protein
MEPDVLIIDEVLAVGDAAFRVKCFNAICELLPETAIIFVSHNMPQISRICTHVMLMDHGTVCYQGNNIGFGISEYFKRLNIKNIKTVQGNGKAEIIEVSIKNPAGSKVSELDYLDALKIELVYKLLEPVATISFLIVIRNEEQIPVIQIKSPELKTDPMTPQQALTINTMIGKLQLNPGKYVMTTSILQGKSDQLLCVCRDVCEFTVRGDEIGYAPILIDAVWYDSEMKNLSSAHSLDNDWHSQSVNHPGHGE